MVGLWRTIAAGAVLPAVGAVGVVLSVLAGAVRAAEPAMDAFLAEAEETCRSFEDGRFRLAPGALSRPDINGDGQADVLLNGAHLICSTATGLYCGRAGCQILVVVDDVAVELFAQSWRIVQMGDQPVLLLRYHGNFCGGDGVMPCVEALVWYQDGFMRP